ncbi:hypothetical protein D3C75_847960 [compost metagenome]
MLGTGTDTRFLIAPYRLGSHNAHHLRILAIRTDANDRVRLIVVHIHTGGKIQGNTQAPQLQTGNPRRLINQLRGTGCAQGHISRHQRYLPVNSRHHPALLVHCDP